MEWLGKAQITEMYGDKPSTVSKYRAEMEKSGLFDNCILPGKNLRIRSDAYAYFRAHKKEIRKGLPVARFA